MQLSEADLLRLIGKFLKELLKNEDLTKGDLIKIAESLENVEDRRYFGDPQPLRKIKKRR